MNSKLKLRESGRTDRAVLGHLVTIGTYLNRDSWGDDLERINGVGPDWESRLREQGITTFEQVVDMDKKVKASLNRYEGVDPPIKKWIKFIKEKNLRSVSAPDADKYLEKVKALSNHFESSGDVATTDRDGSGPATREHDNIFSAPKNDERSQKLEAALRGLVDAAGGVVRVPKLTVDHVAMLKSVADTLGPRQRVDNNTIDVLNTALEKAEISLERVSVAGEEFDSDAPPPPPEDPYGKLPPENPYGILPGRNPYGGVPPASGYTAPGLSNEPAAHYADPNYARFDAPDYYGPESSDSPEQALQAGGGGTRVDGVGYQDAQPHEPQQATPGDEDGVDGGLPEEEPAGDPDTDQEEPAVEPAAEPGADAEEPPEEEL